MCSAVTRDLGEGFSGGFGGRGARVVGEGEGEGDGDGILVFEGVGRALRGLGGRLSGRRDKG